MSKSGNVVKDRMIGVVIGGIIGVLLFVYICTLGITHDKSLADYLPWFPYVVLVAFAFLGAFWGEMYGAMSEWDFWNVLKLFGKMLWKGVLTAVLCFAIAFVIGVFVTGGWIGIVLALILFAPASYVVVIVFMP